VHLTRDQLTAMVRAEAEKKRSAGSKDLAADVDERAIEDEILVREALRLGFDKNDPIVRQRLVQKMLFFAEELAGAGEEPTDDEVRSYFAATHAKWRVPGDAVVRQIFGKDERALATLAANLAAGRVTASAALGTPCPLPYEARLTHAEMTTTFGAAGTAAIDGAPEGRWIGPLRSAYGWHLVLVAEGARREGREAALDEVLPLVRQEYVVEKRHDAIRAYLTRTFPDYRVTIDDTPVTQLHPVARLAVRNEGSGED
jgi:hypothetical protein